MSTPSVTPGQESRPAGQGTPPGRTADRAYRRAWLSLLLFLLSLVLSGDVFALLWGWLNYRTVWALDYPAGPSSPAGWGARGIWLLLAVVYAWPEAVVVAQARKARAAGRPDWLAPVVVGGVLAGLMPLLNIGLLIG